MSDNLMTIPLCQLKRAALNVRKTGRKADIAQLAASIEAHGRWTIRSRAGCSAR